MAAESDSALLGCFRALKINSLTIERFRGFVFGVVLLVIEGLCSEALFKFVEACLERAITTLFFFFVVGKYQKGIYCGVGLLRLELRFGSLFDLGGRRPYWTLEALFNFVEECLGIAVDKLFFFFVVGKYVIEVVCGIGFLHLELRFGHLFIVRGHNSYWSLGTLFNFVEECLGVAFDKLFFFFVVVKYLVEVICGVESLHLELRVGRLIDLRGRRPYWTSSLESLALPIPSPCFVSLTQGILYLFLCFKGLGYTPHPNRCGIDTPSCLSFSLLILVLATLEGLASRCVHLQVRPALKGLGLSFLLLIFVLLLILVLATLGINLIVCFSFLLFDTHLIVTSPHTFLACPYLIDCYPILCIGSLLFAIAPTRYLCIPNPTFVCPLLAGFYFEILAW